MSFFCIWIGYIDNCCHWSKMSLNHYFFCIVLSAVIVEGSRQVIPGPPSNRIEIKMGSSTRLKCQSSKPFNDCRFVGPNGKQYRIGIGGGSAYDKWRVDCLCTVKLIMPNIMWFWRVEVEDYDPTKVCGIVINNLKDEDVGDWRLVLKSIRVIILFLFTRCQMEYKVHGQTTIKSTTLTIVDVDRIGGGSFIKNPGI